jgi:hypothetical protein
MYYILISFVLMNTKTVPSYITQADDVRLNVDSDTAILKI